jgi:hypothetical protein
VCLSGFDTLGINAELPPEHDPISAGDTSLIELHDCVGDDRYAELIL